MSFFHESTGVRLIRLKPNGHPMQPVATSGAGAEGLYGRTATRGTPGRASGALLQSRRSAEFYSALATKNFGLVNLKPIENRRSEKLPVFAAGFSYCSCIRHNCPTYPLLARGNMAVSK